MKINKSLKNINAYSVEFVSQNVRRLHYNESQSAILPREILTQSLFDDLNFYPEDISETLATVAAKFYDSKSDFTIPTNGSDEGLDLIIRTVCNPQDSVVVLKPTFGMYKQYAHICGVNVLEFELDENFEINHERLISFCRESNAKILFVPNPLAPTGGVTARENLLKIVESLPETCVVIDEAYIEFSEEISMINYISTNKNLVVTRTLSKFFGLAGIRLGFVFSQIKCEILKVKAPYNVNKISGQIALNMFEHASKSIVRQRFEWNIRSRADMISWLKRFDEIKKVYESYTNFLFIELDCDSSDFAAKLLHEYGMKIKDFSGEFSRFCRISV